MITYGTVNLRDEKGTLAIQYNKNQSVRHYPGTNKSDVVNLGSGATVISCTLLAFNDAERLLIEQIANDTTESTLTINNFFYKKVIPGAASKPTPAIKYRAWRVDVEFIALDPIPYDVTTGGALY